MIITIEVNYTEEQLKDAYGYSDKVHREIDGQILEIDNPVSFIEHITKDTIGHIENKVTKKGSCC